METNLAQFFVEWELFQTEVVDKTAAYIFIFNNFFFLKSRRLWDNLEKYGRAEGPEIKIRGMHIACWITKATNIRSEYVIFIAFPLKQCLHESASVLRYTYIACVVLYIKCCRFCVVTEGNYL
jgi:hypothetical protein